MSLCNINIYNNIRIVYDMTISKQFDFFFMRCDSSVNLARRCNDRGKYIDCHQYISHRFIHMRLHIQYTPGAFRAKLLASDHPRAMLDLEITMRVETTASLLPAYNTKSS